MPGGTPARHRIKGNPWVVLIAMCLGFFMILLDTTIVTIAIPAISDGLNASLDDILWIQSGYVLVYAVLLITAGRLGDMFGAKSIYLIGLVVFVVASAACGFASNPDQLIAARVVQGVGGALLSPQSLAIITRIFPAERRGVAFGIWGAVAGVAAVAGPTLGGLLITYASWEWIFYLNVPIGIIAFALSAWTVPGRGEQRRHHFDIVGTVLVSVALFLITYGLIEGERYHWGTIRGFVTIPLVIGAGVVVLIAFLLTQYYNRREPLVPFSILRDRNFSLMNLVSLAMSFGMLGMFLPLTIYLQSVLGLSAFDAGLTLAPMPLVSLFIAPFTGRLADRIGGKYILLTGLVLFGTGMAYLIAVAEVHSSRLTFLPALLIAGVGMGGIFAPLTTEAMRGIPPRLSGAASGVFNTTRQLGAVIGTAAVGALLSAQLSGKLTQSAQQHAQALPPAFRSRFVDGFSHVSGSLDVGTHHPSPALPPGIPAQVADQIRALAVDTFRVAFVDAMKPTLLLPIAVLALAAVSCLFLKGRRPTPPETSADETAPAQARPPH
ncbi:DHA2 family efflux MFS transporter permease subunit [Actinocatenispora rupis]|uniref:MFS transporter n=1 Tax=Actinocatenispora rupis TaxID=519421 RepID=A0A8J3JEL9_9ACTN|nr:DHA2 family efflux MFS transporter permease subunit [Actinocatenispora rupis]GID13443.1 MFS transporter [Actinocatenispora rupis]